MVAETAIITNFMTVRHQEAPMTRYSAVACMSKHWQNTGTTDKHNTVSKHWCV
jgi:hypothetical protein